MTNTNTNTNTNTQLPPKAFVLLSGGLDSTTCLYKVIHGQDKRFGADQIVAISVKYGQRHVKETEMASELCDALRIPHMIVALGEQPVSMLTDIKEKIPDANYADLPQGQSPTYVPFRNGQLLSTIAAYASSGLYLDDPKQNSIIYFGAHAEDAENWAYPDCTPEFIGAMANAIYIGSYYRTRLVAPFTYMTKAEIVTLGDKLSVPFEYTWSCYQGGSIHCGICPTCRSRKQAFIDAGVFDPTEYAK